MPRFRRFLSHIAKESKERVDALDREAPLLECIVRRYPAGWLDVAELYEARDNDGDIEKVKECCRRFLEQNQGDETLRVWEKLARVCARSKDTRGEIHALIELATMGAAKFSKISYAANRLNQLASKNELDDFEIQELMRRLSAVMAVRIGEADATDLSRLAWIYLQIHREREAIDCVMKGLNIELENAHCQRLGQRLGISIIT